MNEGKALMYQTTTLFCIVIFLSGCDLKPTTVPRETDIVETPTPINGEIIQPEFIENRGEIQDKEVVYYAKVGGNLILIRRPAEIVYAAYTSDDAQDAYEPAINEIFLNVQENGNNSNSVRLMNDQELGDYLSLGELYKGINILLRFKGQSLEKIFQVDAFADPTQIRGEIKGADSLNIDKFGNLQIELDTDKIHLSRPIAYQEINGARNYVNVWYVIEGDEYSFWLEKYDKTKPLVIDPAIIYNFGLTFLGGQSNDHITAIEVADDGYVYVTGYSDSSDLLGTIPLSSGPKVGFVFCLDPKLGTIESAFWNGQILPRDILIRDDGIYITGTVQQNQYFPSTEGVYREACLECSWEENRAEWGTDSFVMKLDRALEPEYRNHPEFCYGGPCHLFEDIILAATLIGGKGYDGMSSIASSVDGGIYIAGGTTSPKFMREPRARRTFTSYDSGYNGKSDIIIAKMDSELTTLMAATYLGGSHEEMGVYYETGYVVDWDMTQIAVSSLGAVYVSGYSNSDDFPTTSNAYDPTFNEQGGQWFEGDGFISVFDQDLETLISSTFIGAEFGIDMVLGLYVDEDQENKWGDDFAKVYVVGRTESRWFPITQDAIDSNMEDCGEGFITQFDPLLTEVQASSFLGGSHWDHVSSVVVLENKNVVVAGGTCSEDFLAGQGINNQFNGGYNDAFIAVLNSDFSDLTYAHYLGGSNMEDFEELAVNTRDKRDNVYGVGITYSRDFPVLSGFYDSVFGGTTEAFIMLMME